MLCTKESWMDCLCDPYFKKEIDCKYGSVSTWSGCDVLAQAQKGSLYSGNLKSDWLDYWHPNVSPTAFLKTMKKRPTSGSGCEVGYPFPHASDLTRKKWPLRKPKNLQGKSNLLRCFPPSDFGSETVFLVSTASCEKSFWVLEKQRKTSRTQHKKVFQTQIFPQRLEILR
jgi:hypothetical protein